MDKVFVFFSYWWKPVAINTYAELVLLIDPSGLALLQDLAVNPTKAAAQRLSFVSVPTVINFSVNPSLAGCFNPLNHIGCATLFPLGGALGCEGSSGRCQSPPGYHQAVPPAPPSTGGTQESLEESKRLLSLLLFISIGLFFKHSRSPGGRRMVAKAIKLLSFISRANF